MPRAHVLVVDDEPSILTTLQKALSVEGYAVDVAG
jgi:DNA-binding response OmpR family regulator